MSDFVCEPLSKHHDRTQFDCGVTVLNDILRFASQDMNRNAAAVFVLVERLTPCRIIGFYTLCATSVELSALPIELSKRLPRYPDVPAILIGRLAWDIKFAGIGSLLLADALSRCVRVGSEIAATLIIVDAKSDEAIGFYAKFGFLTLPKIPNRLFLPMQTVQNL